MARINIENSWWTDERRFRLAEKLGSIRVADGFAIEVWKLSQEFWGNGRRKIPFYIFKTIENYQVLLDVNLAVQHRETIYIRGTRQYHEWYALSKANSSKGGKSKAIHAKQLASNSLATAVVSSSSSSSISKNKNMCDSNESHPPEFSYEDIYKAYPKRLGAANKGKGIEKLKRIITSQADFDDALNAVMCYNKFCSDTKKVKTELVKMFSSFWDANGDWREWINYNKKQSSKPTMDFKREYP